MELSEKAKEILPEVIREQSYFVLERRARQSNLTNQAAVIALKDILESKADEFYERIKTKSPEVITRYLFGWLHPEVNQTVDGLLDWTFNEKRVVRYAATSRAFAEKLLDAVLE